MKIYRIQDINRNDFCCTVTVVRFGKQRRILELPRNNATDKLKRWNHVIVLNDRYGCCEDYAYVYRGGCHLNVVPGLTEKLACCEYIENLNAPELSFDRDVFEYGLFVECRRRGLRPSWTLWHNLQNIMMDRARF